MKLFIISGTTSSSGTGGAAVSMNEVGDVQIRWALICKQAPLPLSSSAFVRPRLCLAAHCVSKPFAAGLSLVQCFASSDVFDEEMIFVARL